MTSITFEQIPGQLIECMMNTETHINSLGLAERSLLELMRYYVSVLNGCAYCVDMHYKEAIAAGENNQRLYSVKLWRETSFYNDKEQALLGWTEYVTKLNGTRSVREELFKSLRLHFSIEEIANLTLAIAQINAWTRLAKPFNFQPGTYEVGQH